MSGWSAPDFLDQLKILLDARTGLTGLTPTVKVFTYWPALEESVTDAIILASAEDTDEQTVMNPASKPRDEDVTVDGLIWVSRAGAGETIAQAARDRAQLILNEVDEQLRTIPPAVVLSRQAGIVSHRLDQRPSDSAGAAVRVCVLDFTIRYRARTTT
jgi:hypothetical protein